MKKLIVFGLGQKYIKYKSALLSKYDIVALADNDTQKQGGVIDGITVIPPERIREYAYDFVVIMAGKATRSQMSQQLKEMRIANSKIVYGDDFAALIPYREMFGIYTRLKGERLLSSVCRPTDLESIPGWNQLSGMSFSYGQKAGPTLNIDENNNQYCPHRKIWEHLYTCQALEERGLLKPGISGLCFAAGTEPLPAIFADMGCIITATDAPPDVAGVTWSETNQHSDTVNDIYYPHIIQKEKFHNNVSFRYADMNHISSDLNGYDFLWSSCALEHLGSVHAAKEFIYRAMNCLKPGGVAVHTTEYNLTSNIITTIRGGTCPLRSIDLIEIAEHLEYLGHHVEPLDFRLDDSLLDYIVSYPPEYSEPHFKIPFENNSIITSFGLIVQKAF